MDVLDWIRGDRLGARTVTARCLWQISRMRAHIRRYLAELRLPLLVLEATSDRISDNESNRRLLARALGSRLQVVPFEAEHFLLAEPCRDRVVDTLAAWVGSEGP
jgi:alpha-beta hydrolase superfamily lysophospholipase